MEENRQSLIISIIGETNAGKSSFVNRIINKKLSIVTPKINTTKSVVPIILTEDQYQLIFYDTIGISREIDENCFNKANKHVIKNSELIILILDIRRIFGLDDLLKVKFIKNKESIIIVNKTDLIDNISLIKIKMHLEEKFFQKKIFYLNRNSSLSNIINYLKKQSLERKWIYPEDQLTTKTMSFITSELTRESLLMMLEKEIPYKLRVKTDYWIEKKVEITIYQTIIVEKESHKKIILGLNGSKMKKISITTRQKIESLLSKKVNLYLFVKISKIQLQKFKKIHKD